MHFVVRTPAQHRAGGLCESPALIRLYENIQEVPGDHNVWGEGKDREGCVKRSEDGHGPLLFLTHLSWRGGKKRDLGESINPRKQRANVIISGRSSDA